MCRKGEEIAFFGTRGLKCGIQCTTPHKKCGNWKPSFCVAFQRGSGILRILARVSQPGGGYGQPLPRRLCACDAQCCREKGHVHCGSSNPTLTDPSVSSWWSPFCLSLRCVVCTSDTAFFCASVTAFLIAFRFRLTFQERSGS